MWASGYVIRTEQLNSVHEATWGEFLAQQPLGGRRSGGVEATVGLAGSYSQQVFLPAR